jgi:DNA-binding transcriptional LysR family regulator
MTTRKSPTAPGLPDLHLLIVLQQTGSYTQAAQRLGISKASVSTRIADLERAIGIPLVRRTTRSVGLTAVGQQLAEETRPALERIEQSLAHVRDLSGAPRGLVRITAPVALGRQVIAPMLAGFLREYPQVRLELDLNDRLVNLANEGFDLAVRHTQAPPETHIAWKLRSSRSLLVASADYVRRHGKPAHPSELEDHACLLYLRGSGRQNWSFERMDSRKAERVQVTVDGPLRANNSEVLREAVVGGVGIGLLPDFSVSGQRPKLVVDLLPQWRALGAFGEGIYAIRPWSAQIPRAVQCLIDYLRKALGEPVTRGR